MTQQPKHLETTKAIDLHLSDDSFNAAARNSAHKNQPWYALLNVVALLVAQEEDVYAHTDYESTMANVRIAVFTTNCLRFRHDPILVSKCQEPPRNPERYWRGAATPPVQATSASSVKSACRSARPAEWQRLRPSCTMPHRFSKRVFVERVFDDHFPSRVAGLEIAEGIAQLA